METYRILSRETYPRRAHLDYFCTMAQPYAGLTVPVDITDFYQAVGARKVPFFLSFLYCAARAANGVPELRQRLRGEEILEYDHCPTSHTAQFGRRGRGGCPAPPLHLHPALGALRGPCPAHPQPGRHQPTDHLGAVPARGGQGGPASQPPVPPWIGRRAAYGPFLRQFGEGTGPVGGERRRAMDPF